VIRRLIIPKELGEAIEVRLLDWMKSEGEAIHSGDALLEFETDKALVLVTASQDGVLRRVFFKGGDWMKPGDVVAWLSDHVEEALPESIDAAVKDLTVSFDVT
jgi:pyruvate/2-oxoglutarate dehydrogenase complex dihydrolipoamide acyltransferase (E2) component